MNYYGQCKKRGEAIMSTTKKVIWLAGVLFLAGMQSPARSITANEIIAKVQSKYDDIENIFAKFTQSIRYKVSKIEQENTGTIYFKKKNKYRIESEQQVVVTDGVTSWAYNAKNKQVIINKYKEDAKSLSPEKLLFSYPKDYYSSYIGEEKVLKEEMYVLKLTPKEDNTSTGSIKVWINHDWLIKQVEVVDMNKTITRYTMKELKIDKGIPDTQFQFSVPAGVDVVDLR